MAGVAELEEDVRALLQAADPQLERGAQPHRRLVEGKRGGSGARCQDVVFDTAPGSAEPRCGGEVVGKIGERAAGALPGTFESLAHPQMKLRPPRP